MPYVVLAGLVLMAAYIVFINATLQSVGVFGVGLIGAVFAAAVWVLTDLGLIQIGSSSAMTWLSLVGLSLILGIGLSWSIIRRQLSGQVDVDEIDD
jgi:ABC-type nickel/cobalt efflux system permease component RcnA